MFIQLQTKNFRKLTGHTFSFLPGLNAIRGLNEHGKSTLFEAIGYALFGSEALRESLDDVVTWGEKVSTLKVQLDWQVNNQLLTITRGKSGAEVYVDGKLTVTGQKEVTRFVEEHLTDAKLAAKLMLANQASLRGALSEGPTAAARLIEQLSNFELIDEIIELFVANLPTGSSAMLDQQLSAITARLESEKPQAPDLQALEAQKSEYVAKIRQHSEQAAEIREALVPAKAAADAARAQYQALNTARALQQRAQTDLEAAKQRLLSLNLEARTTPERVEELRRLLAEQASLEQERAAWQALQGLKRPEVDWEGDYASFRAAWRETTERLEAARTASANWQSQRAAAFARIIREQTCAFCGKDLQDVPEVVKRNAEASAEVQHMDAEIEKLAGVIQECRETLPVYEAIEKAHKIHTETVARYETYLEADLGRVPHLPRWRKAEPPKAVAADYRRELQEAEAELARVARVQGEAKALTETVRTAEASLAAAQAEVLRLEPLVAADRSVATEQDLLTALAYQQQQQQEVTALLRGVEGSLASVMQAYERQCAAYKQLEADRERVLQNQAELAANNVLLKKLRAARPKVADKLWSIVLSTVSFYFSQIRGTQSVVTKEDSGFKVDGKPVTGLSGSTLDALGLAIRIALTKTFMPNTDFLVLDEPGAACDEEREANMLGLVSACGFEQVLLVTHSQLADVFADSVIAL